MKPEINKKKFKKKFTNEAERESQKLGRKLGLGIKSPVPHSVSAATESHVKNYTAAPASRQLQRGVSE